MYAAQETLSSAASNYDVTRLMVGTGLAALSIFLTLFTLPPMFPVTPAGLSYTLILVLYSVLMFASSYVEEEHNFWYWATSGWFFYLFIAESRKEGMEPVVSALTLGIVMVGEAACAVKGSAVPSRIKLLHVRTSLGFSVALDM